MFLSARSLPRKNPHRHDRGYGREALDRYVFADQAYGYEELLRARMDPRMDAFEGIPILQPGVGGCVRPGGSRAGGLNSTIPGDHGIYGGMSPAVGASERRSSRAEDQIRGPVNTGGHPQGTHRRDEQLRGTRGIHPGLDSARHVQFQQIPSAPIRGSGRHLGVSFEESMEALSLQDLMFRQQPIPGLSEYHPRGYYPLGRHSASHSVAEHQIPETHTHSPRTQRHCLTHCRDFHEGDSREHGCHAHMRTEPESSSSDKHSSKPRSEQPRAAVERTEHRRPSAMDHYPPLDEDYRGLLSGHGGMYGPTIEEPFLGKGYWYDDDLYGPYSPYIL